MPRLCQGPGHRCHTTIPRRELIHLASFFCAPCLGQIGGDISSGGGWSVMR